MDLVYCLAQRCKLKSATITLPDDLTRINLYTEMWVRGCRAVSKLVKTDLNTAITAKLLKSKVTLNICEKLKMTQRDTGNIKSKVNETCFL